ncbi:MAG: glycine cleavage system aminomethyltransferase GcvT [Deltaproteobacteria bacterium]|nr:glycine cleavage system aminomethyltransferase GcvT [Deltaproteobacteria bacterium]
MTEHPANKFPDPYAGVTLRDRDAAVQRLVDLETERQARRVILIPSESICPAPVREALASPFSNIYAEGYPSVRMTRDEESRVLDYAHQLSRCRRYSNRRFYKGCDYADFVEVLAQRRAAAIFATVSVPAEQIFVNVQPLSGAAANNSVYEAFVSPGDCVMGMNLAHGGHLTHGSPFNRSGKRYGIVSYGVDPKTDLLDYDRIAELAREHRPKMIIAGWTSYPWAPDWGRFRAIADSVGARLLADVSHPAGLIAAGEYPNPIGIADAVVFTTHKTMCGPRGAVIMTTDEDLARAIDTAVFPGEQGGPHINKMAAMAVAFGIAATPGFTETMRQIVRNAKGFAEALAKEGLRVCHGGTNTHLLLVDLNAVPTTTGWRLKGEIAARILELCGIVCNKNTIPGDATAADASGIRLGTPWITQRGFGAAEVDALAGLIAKVLRGIRPFEYEGLMGRLPRGKIDRGVLAEVREGVDSLLGVPEGPGAAYPHSCRQSGTEAGGVIRIAGERPAAMLDGLCTGPVVSMKPGEARAQFLLGRDSALLARAVVLRRDGDFVLFCDPRRHAAVLDWLRGISDGYLLFDDDILRKVEGPATVEELEGADRDRALSDLRAAGGEVPAEAGAGANLSGTGAAELYGSEPSRFDITKPYFVGQKALASFAPAARKEEFRWAKKESAPKRSCLYEVHKKTAKKVIPFAGWEMPVWYTSIADEHRAVREAAGLFDVSHMGVFEVAGEHAEMFLNLVSTNYASWIEPGQSQYGYLLDPDGDVIDDIMIYRRARDRFLVVVNASNADKDFAWLNLVNDGKALLDRAWPCRAPNVRVNIRNLKDPSAGTEMRVDIALQGPASIRILMKFASDAAEARRIRSVRRTDLLETKLSGIDAVIARTGYTGEDFGYEVFVHPDRAPEFWGKVLSAGAEFGVKPCGLGARDSTRTEAGLPLYGHELSGPHGISPAGAGFAPYVKIHKPFFVGRDAYIEKEKARTMEVLRFQIREKGVRMAKTGDAVANKRGVVAGFVTSCAMDVEGFQTGLAYCDRKAHVPGDPIAVFCSTGSPVDVAVGQPLKPGAKVLLPVDGVVLPRFRRKA